MLDAFIIEELKRREREDHDVQRPVLELPVDQRRPPRDGDDRDGESEEDARKRGIVIIDTLC